MKTKSFFTVLITFIIAILFFSCRHESPPESCESIGFKLTILKTDALLNASNGTITATATGGKGFQYSLNGSKFKDSGYFTGLAAFGNYIVVGRNSTGCTDTVDVNIGSFDPCAGVTINVTTTKVDASLNQSNGSITATATGGNNFTYSLNGSAFQSSGIFSNLAAGNYTIAAKSAAGCIGITQTAIGTNDPCAGVTVTITTTTVQPGVNVSNGSITATASGGTGFTFSLNNGVFQPSGTFSGLAAGNYTVTAKNSNGCTGIKSVAIVATDPCAGVTVAVTTTNVQPATGLSNGSITAIATGGTGFTYSINSGAFQASGTFSNLATGNYTITAKNSNGCTGVTTVALGNSNPCAGVTVTITSTTINPSVGLSNGSITSTASGGTGFTYSLNNGTFQTSGTFSGLAAGTYTITAKNSNGCSGAATVTLTNVDPCAGITVVVTTTQVDPSTGLTNGSITATATGGSGFSYSLNNSTYQSSGTFSNLAAGTYTITAKNSNGCIGVKQITLTAISPCTNTNIILTATIVNTTPCVTPANNGSITVTASGSSGFMYNLNGGAYQVSNVFSLINAGNYLMGVKDVNGCTKTLSVTVAVVAPGPLFSQMRTLITTRCSGSGCHMNGTTTAGYNFDTDCSIVTKWSQINGACVTYTLKKMPISPQTPLTTAEKQIITNWVNAGHRYTD